MRHGRWNVYFILLVITSAVSWSIAVGLLGRLPTWHVFMSGPSICSFAYVNRKWCFGYQCLRPLQSLFRNWYGNFVARTSDAQQHKCIFLLYVITCIWRWSGPLYVCGILIGANIDCVKANREEQRKYRLQCLRYSGRRRHCWQLTGNGLMPWPLSVLSTIPSLL